MEFNQIIRGHKRQKNTEEAVLEILDSSFLCTVAFMLNNTAMQIPMSYGRKENTLLLHGAASNAMIAAICNGQTCSIGVTILDGLVLAKSLFDTGFNYRSLVLIGQAELITDEAEHLEALQLICEHIIPGRVNEVPLGTPKQIKATSVVRFHIQSASAKVRSGGPSGDEKIDSTAWSGEIPVRLVAEEPILDEHREAIEPSISVQQFVQQMNYNKK